MLDELAVIDVLLFYVEQNVGLIRLDAVAFLWKEIGTSCMEPIGREWEYLRKETHFQKSLSIEKPNTDDWAHIVLSKDKL